MREEFPSHRACLLSHIRLNQSLFNHLLRLCLSLDIGGLFEVYDFWLHDGWGPVVVPSAAIYAWLWLRLVHDKFAVPVTLECSS